MSFLGTSAHRFTQAVCPEPDDGDRCRTSLVVCPYWRSARCSPIDLVDSAETPSSSSVTADEPLDRRLDSAAAQAAKNVPIAAPDHTVDSVLNRMRGVQFDSAAVVAVCSGRQLVGLVTIERLLAAPGQAAVSTAMDAQPPVVAPGVDQEHAAWLAAQRAESGLAVVDEQRRFQGLIPPQRLAAILLEEHDEDLARLGGFLKSSAEARSASRESVGRRLWHRLPWLAVGLIGAMVSAVLLAGIEHQISANLAVAYFIPGIVYLADAVGTQTETLAIRGLSVGVGIGGVAPREAATGFLVGLLLAAAMFPTISLLWHDVALAAAVSLAVLAASTVATLVAMALPYLLHRLGYDPAFGSGPLATVIQDLLSILLYLAAVRLIL
jgi:magnesium transporter